MNMVWFVCRLCIYPFRVPYLKKQLLFWNSESDSHFFKKYSLISSNTERKIIIICDSILRYLHGSTLIKEKRKEFSLKMRYACYNKRKLSYRHWENWLWGIVSWNNTNFNIVTLSSTTQHAIPPEFAKK